MKRIPYLIRKELLQLRRDRRMLPIVFVAPVMQLLILGYAANLDVSRLRLAVVDQDRGALSRRVEQSLTASGTFETTRRFDAVREAEPHLVKGQVDVLLVIPPDFSRPIEAGRPGAIQLIADGSDSNAAGIGLGYAVQAAARAGEDVAGAEAAPLQARIFYNPSLRSRNFFVPGILALLLMVMTMLLTSLALVKEKERGTLEQLIVTPLRPLELMLGKLLPFALIGFVDVLLVLAAARLLFGIWPRGSVPLLLSMSAVFLLTTLGLGLFISTISRTQQQAMMTAVFFILLPMVMLSGFVFPIESMPAPIRVVSYLLPLRYYFVIIRGIFLKGAGLAELWDEGLALLAFGLLVVGVSAARFRKRLS